MSLERFINNIKEIDYTDLTSWPFWLKILVIMLIGLAVIGGTFTYLHTTKLKQVREGEIKEEKLKKEYLDKRKKSISLPLYRTQMEEIKDRFAVLLQQLPNKAEIPSLLTDISQAGTENGLEFKRFRPKKEITKDFFVDVPIQIKASGSYHQLATFVSDIANFQRIVTLGDFKMVRNTASDKSSMDQPPLVFDAEVITYRYQEEALAPAPEEGGPKERVTK